MVLAPSRIRLFSEGVHLLNANLIKSSPAAVAGRDTGNESKEFYDLRMIFVAVSDSLQKRGLHHDEIDEETTND
jgi:hypothetical protein